MLNNTHISKPGRSSFPVEAANTVLFGIVFVLLGCFRIVQMTFLYLLDLLFRLCLAILVYSLLGLIIASAVVVILSYYLIALPGSQIRIP